MAIVTQKLLFDWTEVEELGDLKRLELVLKALPDEGLMRELERETRAKVETITRCERCGTL